MSIRLIVHAASLEVGQQVAALQPDTVLLSTPHGMADLGTRRTTDETEPLWH